jgi:hypothetical protein
LLSTPSRLILTRDSPERKLFPDLENVAFRKKPSEVLQMLPGISRKPEPPLDTPPIVDAIRGGRNGWNRTKVSCLMYYSHYLTRGLVLGCSSAFFLGIYQLPVQYLSSYALAHPKIQRFRMISGPELSLLSIRVCASRLIHNAGSTK